MKKIKLIPLAVILCLSGCVDQVEPVQDQINAVDAEIKSKKLSPVELNDVNPSNYDVTSYRSPFLSNDVFNLVQSGAYRLVRAPIRTRLQPLERYPIESLVISGVIGSKRPDLLIKAPDGNLKTVKVGDYIGQNQGRIISITANAVEVIELFPTSNDGLYLEKKRVLTTADQATNNMGQGAVQPLQIKTPNTTVPSPL